MFKRVIFQGFIVISSFLLLWIGFTKIDFMGFFKAKEHIQNLEVELGELIWENIENSEDVIRNDSIDKTIRKLILPICKVNNIEIDSLKIHIINKDEINAFALPHNHIVIYSGLIEDCKNQEALQGVIGHEMAHIINNHLMKKLSKEIGISVLLSATTGGDGGATIGQIVNTLTSSAYDRNLEKEADISSVKYMIKAQINPKPMADFMYQLAQESSINENFYWIADHPESEERSKYILHYIKGKKISKKLTISQSDWEDFKTQISSIK